MFTPPDFVNALYGLLNDPAVAQALIGVFTNIIDSTAHAQ